jgi:hypothetical protein
LKSSGSTRIRQRLNASIGGGFSLLQEWETREDLDHHLASHRFGALLGTKALLSEPIGIQILTISQSEGMDAIRSVRKKESIISPTDW